MLKIFRINWYKPESGGGCEDLIGIDILECLKAFYEKWQDVGKCRFVISIEELQDADLHQAIDKINGTTHR